MRKTVVTRMKIVGKISRKRMRTYRQSVAPPRAPLRAAAGTASGGAVAVSPPGEA